MRSAAALLRKTDFYLCRAYSAQRGGAARSLDALVEHSPGEHCRRGAADCCAKCRFRAIGWSPIARATLATSSRGCCPSDRHRGSIRFPDGGATTPGRDWFRRKSWPGSRILPEGFLATANDDRNQPGKPRAINICQGSYRRERIAELLTAKPQLSIADMQQIQSDLFSPQARRFMAFLRPLIPDTPAGKILADWDLRYDVAVAGCHAVRGVLPRALREVFGKGLFGLEVWDALVATTNLLGAYFQVFDEALAGTETNSGSAGRDGTRSSVRFWTCVLAVPVQIVRPVGRAAADHDAEPVFWRQTAGIRQPVVRRRPRPDRTRGRPGHDRAGADLSRHTADRRHSPRRIAR